MSIREAHRSVDQTVVRPQPVKVIDSTNNPARNSIIRWRAGMANGVLTSILITGLAEGTTGKVIGGALIAVFVAGMVESHRQGGR